MHFGWNFQNYTLGKRSSDISTIIMYLDPEKSTFHLRTIGNIFYGCLPRLFLLVFPLSFPVTARPWTGTVYFQCSQIGKLPQSMINLTVLNSMTGVNGNKSCLFCPSNRFWYSIKSLQAYTAEPITHFCIITLDNLI